MDIIIKLLHTLFFGAIFYIIFMRYNYRISVKTQYIISLIINLVILFSLNTFYSVVPNKLLFILLVFSLSIIVLNFIKDYVDLGGSKLLENSKDVKNNYDKIKNAVFSKIVPIMIFFYQLLLIWFPVVFERMSQKY